jgi:hypothetical protein
MFFFLSLMVMRFNVQRDRISLEAEIIKHLLIIEEFDKFS